MNNSNQIQVKNLRIRYDEREIIHGVSFVVMDGEFVSIIGRSGCGKSSLLYALAGFIHSTGDVTVPARMGMVFQSYAVFPWLSVEKNIAFGLQNRKVEIRKAIVKTHLEMTGLSTAAQQYPYQLSGGQIQRVALARALAPNPEIILMDEPFGALDFFTRDRMQEWLLSIWEANRTTILFVTHNVEEAMYLSDKIIIMGEGRILGEQSVTFARPRREALKFTPEFTELKRTILSTMEHEQLQKLDNAL